MSQISFSENTSTNKLKQLLTPRLEELLIKLHQELRPIELTYSRIEKKGRKFTIQETFPNMTSHPRLQQLNGR